MYLIDQFYFLFYRFHTRWQSKIWKCRDIIPYGIRCCVYNIRGFVLLK